MKTCQFLKLGSDSENYFAVIVEGFARPAALFACRLCAEKWGNSLFPDAFEIKETANLQHGFQNV